MLLHNQEQAEEQETTLNFVRDDWSIQPSAVILTRAQRFQLITIFTEALVRNVSGRYPPLADNTSSIPLHQRFQSLLKEFSEKAKNGTSDKLKQRASRVICSLRVEISQKCEHLFLGEEDEGSHRSRALPGVIKDADKALPQRPDYWQKVGDRTRQIEQSEDWFSQMSRPPELHQGSPDSSRATSSARAVSDDDDLRDAISAGEERMIFDYLTGHEAFSALISEFERIVERHYVNTLQLIQKRVMLALKRCRESQTPQAQNFEVLSSYDLDISSFLRDQYGTSDVDLGQVLTITGRPKNAQLLPVSEYMLQTWEAAPLALLDAFRQQIARDALKTSEYLFRYHETILAKHVRQLIMRTLGQSGSVLRTEQCMSRGLRI